MKLKSILWLCFIALTSNVVAQAPDIINYQAIVRDINNTVIANQSVSVKFVITEGLPTGTVIYEENQSPTTNSHGLINLKIGTGAFIVGTLAAIDWSANSYYLTTSIDPTGGSNYTLSGVSELVSVPYALHAKTVDNADDADADPINEIQDLQLVGDDLSITNNGAATVIDLAPYAVDTVLNEAEVDAFVSNNGYLTAELDDDPTNEIQTISLSGSTITLSNSGGSVSINDADASPTNEIELPTGGTNGQILKTNGSGVYAWVNQADDGDADPTNEIELPTGGTSGQVLRTNGSGTYTWVNQANDADADPTNEIELPTGGTSGQVLRTNGSGTYTWVNQANDADADPTNEIELPTGGTNGQVLKTDGSGNYAWVNQSAGSSSYKIGQQLNGGTIIFVDSSGIHGLIVANSDLAGTYAYQSDGPNQVAGATSYYDGKANTIALAAASGTYNAADACAALGDGNWYLPSYSEFIVIYSNMHLLTGFDFSVAIYWTSTTTTIFAPSLAASFYLTGSANFNQTLITQSKVRAVRQF